MKKLISFFLAGVLVVSCMGVVVFAEDSDCDVSSELLVTDENQLSSLAEEYEIEIPQGFELTEIYVQELDPSLFEVPQRAPRGTISLRNVTTASGTWYYPSTVTNDEATNYSHTITDTFSKSYTKSAKSEFSASVGVSASVVTAGVGFSIGVTTSETTSYSTSVPPRKRVRIESKVRALKKNFDVYDGNTYKGSGSASRPNGIVFAKFESSI